MSRVIIFLLVTIGLAIALPYITDPDFWQKDEPVDYQAAEKLMDYIGAKMIIERDFFDRGKMRVDNDTLYGLRYDYNHFFIQSLTDTSYFVEFTADPNQAPSYLYREPDRFASSPMYLFDYYENGCIYFGGRARQIDKLCKDGSHEALLSYEAMEKRTGSPRAYAVKHWNDKIIQGTKGGVFIFNKKSGEIVWKWNYEGQDSGGIKIVGNKLIFVDVIRDLEKTKLIGLNLENLEKAWQIDIPEKRRRSLQTNYDDIVVFHGRTIGKSYFVEINTGNIVYKTKNTPSGNSNYGHLGEFFSNINASYAYLHIEGGLGKYDFKEEELIWKKENVVMHFPYKDWVVFRGKSKGQDGELDQFVVVNRETGKEEKVIKIEGKMPSFALHDRYIQIGTKIYK